MELVIVMLIGCVLGRISAGWSAVMLKDMNSGGLIRCSGCKADVGRTQRWIQLTPIRCRCRHASVRWHLASTVGLGLAFVLFTWLLLNLNCQTTEEVRPSAKLLYSRLPFHLSLIFLMWVATVTDFLDYVIPDEVIYAGTLIAICSACASGELQLIHIWVNWDDVIPGVRGPYLPEWMKHHQHLHGFVWSLAGLTSGAVLTWIVRLSSKWILGYPALGFGDVTLMAMIGAYLGWQPTLCVLAMAPLTGIVVGLFVYAATGRTFVAYGPYLTCSAFITICCWRWLWADYFSLRDIFSHWPSIAALVGGALLALIILLGLLRLFRTLPAESLRR